MGEGTKVEKVTGMCILKSFPHRVLMDKPTASKRISSLSVKKGAGRGGGVGMEEYHGVLGELKSSRQ